jgi:hypothetical protein
VVPGNPDSQSSYRSELVGIFGQVTLVNALCKTHGITQGAIECGCDSLGALQKVFILDTDIKTAGSNFDLLLSATRTAIRDSPVTWIFRHVKGHQDDDIETNLDRWALLNIEMDSLDKTYWLEQSAHPAPTNSTFTWEYWPVFIQARAQHPLPPTIFLI